MKSKLFANKIVLIIGGGSPLSRGIVHSFLNQGATVIVPARELDEIDHLKHYVRKLGTGNLISQLIDYPGINISEDIVRKFGQIDIAIGLLTESEYRTLLSDVYITEWLEMAEEELTPSLVSVRIVLHLLKEKKTDFFVNVSENAFPDEDESGLNKVSFTLKMEMSKLFASDAKKEKVSYYQVWVNNFYKRDAINGYQFQRPSAETIGDQIMELYNQEKTQADGLFQLLSGQMANSK